MRTRSRRGGGIGDDLGLARFPDLKTRPAVEEAAGREIVGIIERAADRKDPFESKVWLRIVAGESRREAAREAGLDRSMVQRAAKKISERLRKQLGLDEDGRESRD